jgi:hypothetical protein
MERRNTEKLRKHGLKASTALPERRVTTNLFFESDRRSCLWVTARGSRTLSR